MYGTRKSNLTDTLTSNSSQAEPQHNHLIEAWIARRESGLHRKKWASTYKDLQLLYIHKYFQAFTAVTPENLEQWLSRVPVEQHSKRKHMHSVVSSFADFLQYKGLLNRDDYLKIRLLHPKKSHYQNSEPNTINREELITLLLHAAVGPHKYQALLNHTLLLFLSETGLRVSEACSLLSNDIHFGDSPYLLVRCGKGGKSRKVPFSKWAQLIVREYLKDRPESQYENLFLAFNPKCGFTPLNKNCVATRFRRLRQKTGIVFTAHTLRHYCITNWANNPKYSIAVVQQWAGHSSLIVTQHYIHIDVEASLKLGSE